ncbi:DUF4270 family protein [Chitinophaga lutea]
MQQRIMLWALGAACGLAACTKAGFEYDNVPQDGNVQYTVIDTVTIDMRTVQADSLVTSGTGTLLAGGYADPYFGIISAGSYFRVGLPSERSIEDRAVYDSLELIMRPDGSWYGDTLIAQTFRVQQLAQPLTLPEDYYALYSHQQFPLAGALAAQPTPVYPAMAENIHIRLSDAKGNELFGLLKTKAQEVSSDDFFREYFRGLYVSTDQRNAVYGFHAADSALYVRLHYHVTTHETEEKYLDFQLTAPELQFNAIRNDRSHTPLQALTAGAGGLPSAQAGNLAFVQPLTGALARLDFPYLRNLLELGRYGRVMSAQLMLRPEQQSYASLALPPQLALAVADSKHLVGSGDTLYATSGATQYGSLSVDFLYPENTRYVYDVTNYIKSMITATSYDYRGLLLIPPAGAYRSRFNRLVMGDMRNSAAKAELKIYYLLYK